MTNPLVRSRRRRQDLKMPMTAELRMLAPGHYRWRLVDASGKDVAPPGQVEMERGRFGRLVFTLPARQTCTLKLESMSMR